jgi:hypothetical protein
MVRGYIRGDCLIRTTRAVTEAGAELWSGEGGRAIYAMVEGNGTKRCSASFF